MSLCCALMLQVAAATAAWQPGEAGSCAGVCVCAGLHCRRLSAGAWFSWRCKDSSCRDERCSQTQCLHSQPSPAHAAQSSAPAFTHSQTHSFAARQLGRLAAGASDRLSDSGRTATTAAGGMLCSMRPCRGDGWACRAFACVTSPAAPFHLTHNLGALRLHTASQLPHPLHAQAATRLPCCT